MSQPVCITPKPRRAEISPIIRQPSGGWRRSAEIMAISRPIPRKPAINAPNELCFIGTVVLPIEWQCARMSRDRSFQVWHGGEPIPAGDGVDLAIPCATPKTVIEPLDRWPRQPPLLAAQEIHHFSLQRAVVTLAVERRGAGGRIEATIETPQHFADHVSAIE